LSQPTWFDANPKKAKLLVVVVCIVFVEVAVRVCVGFGLLPYTRYPTSRTLQFWTKSEPVVGAWHQPDMQFHDDRDCFEGQYESNSMGARDRERSKRFPGQRRGIVLGDSLVEGLGVAYGKRVTEALEELTGVEHLNIATSGWGTIQQWLFYETYMSEYDHTDVFLFFFPANDFKENDPDLNGSGNYKPFLRDAGDTMEVYYPVAYEDRDTGGRSRGSALKNMIDNSSYFANVLRHAYRMSKAEVRQQQERPFYNDYSDRDLEVLSYVLERLAGATAGRSLYLVTIPGSLEVQYVRKYGYEFPLMEELEQFAARHANVEFIDLLPYTLRYLEEHALTYGALTLGCDWHWGELGNRVAAEAIVERAYAER
jgi:hypothetical protein